MPSEMSRVPSRARERMAAGVVGGRKREVRTTEGKKRQAVTCRAGNMQQQQALENIACRRQCRGVGRGSD